MLGILVLSASVGLWQGVLLDVGGGVLDGGHLTVLVDALLQLDVQDIVRRLDVMNTRLRLDVQLNVVDVRLDVVDVFLQLEVLNTLLRLDELDV